MLALQHLGSRPNPFNGIESYPDICLVVFDHLLNPFNGIESLRRRPARAYASSVSRIHSMELKELPVSPWRAGGTAVENPFNGIERHDGDSIAWVRDEFRIHSMELKAFRSSSLFPTLTTPNPFNGIESHVVGTAPHERRVWRESIQWN